jgi:acyl-CoA reductase-like NAD-dependent aldehyde dehydrogenase
MDTFNLFIKDANPTGNFNVIRTPFDGAEIASIEKADSTAVEQAFVNAEYYFEKVMKRMPAHEKARILYKVSELMINEHEDLSMTIALEGGKPLADARIEVTRAINTVKMSGDEALQLNGQQLTMDRSAGTENHIAFSIRQPLGVVLAISAFNHPVNLICHQVATAIAAGNTCLVKPASTTPISCLKMAKLFQKAGLPDGVINVLTISGSETDKIISDKRIRFVSFIGSGEVGWNIRKKIHNGVGCAFEHGGTAVAVVDKLADLGKAIPALVKGGYYHAGQVCVSTQIIYAHEDIYDDFVVRFKESVSKLITGDPTLSETQVGPLIRNQETDRVELWINEAIEQGAKLSMGGHRISNSTFEPTILENVTEGMRVWKEEIFGPVVCIIKYNDLEEVICAINHKPFSFQNCIYSQDIDVAMHFARSIETKACMINEHTAFRVDWMPFGGSKESGLSMGGIRYSIEEMTEEKMIIIKNSINN